MAEKYQGWTNYETWSVALWMDNSQVDQEFWQEIARRSFAEAEKSKNFTRKEEATFVLREIMKDAIEDASPLAEDAGLYSQLLSGAISEVNFHEIAANILEEMSEEDLRTEPEPEEDIGLEDDIFIKVTKKPGRKYVASHLGKKVAGPFAKWEDLVGELQAYMNRRQVWVDTWFVDNKGGLTPVPIFSVSRTDPGRSYRPGKDDGASLNEA